MRFTITLYNNKVASIHLFHLVGKTFSAHSDLKTQNPEEPRHCE